jgi:large subunit ribosomal protein L13
MKTANKSYLAKAGGFTPQWYVLDAATAAPSLGRLATRIATVLMGKHKPIYTPHVDTGDFVIVLNAGQVKVRGTRKKQQVVYHRYTGHPSGLKETTMETMLARYPERVLREAVRRMLPKNAIGRRMLTKLKLYNTSEHPHQAQQPEPWPFN